MTRGAAPVAVTGVGLLTALGAGTLLNWRRLLAGESGVRTIARFATEGLPATIAACVDFLDLPADATVEQRAIAMGDSVVDEALGRARLSPEDPFDGGFFLAPPVFEIAWPQLTAAARQAGVPTYAAVHARVRGGFPPLAGAESAVALHYARRHQLARLPLCAMTACASGATALQFAVEAIRRGECRRAVVLGTEGNVRPETVARFGPALSTASDVPARAAKPFSADRDGFVIGEGAAALVLEDGDSASRRGAEVLAYVLGCGETGDNFQRSRGDPSARPIVECMRAALRDARLDVDDIDYINAHGTGTRENDKTEALGIHALLGARAARVPVSAVKSMIGHTLAAGGAITAVCTVMSIVTGMLPPTINHRKLDPEIALDVVPNAARKQRVRAALSNAFGVGGQNVCIAFGSAC